MRTTRIAAVVGVAALLLTGCGQDADPEPTEDPSASASATTEAAPEAEETEAEGVRVDVEIADGAVTPQGERVEVTVGEPITLSVTSDHEDEIHVHADPEVSLDAKPGETVEKTFTIETPGQAAVESHHLGVTIVQLVVRPE